MAKVKISASVEPELVKKIASYQGKYSFSITVETLIEEAIAAREKKKGK